MLTNGKRTIIANRVQRNSLPSLSKIFTVAAWPKVTVGEELRETVKNSVASAIRSFTKLISITLGPVCPGKNVTLELVPMKSAVPAVEVLVVTLNQNST